MRFRQILLVSLGLLSACSGKLNAQAGSDGDMNKVAAGSPETWIVDSSKAVCQGVNQQLCLKARQPHSEQFQLIYDGIQGLDFSWGHTYTLAVEQGRSPSAPQDASSVTWQVTAVLESKEDAIGTRYSYPAVNLTDYTVETDGQNYFFLGQAFSCAKAQLCAALARVESPRLVDLEFAYMGKGEIELVEWRAGQ